MRIKNKLCVLMSVVLLTTQSQTILASVTDSNENSDIISYSVENSNQEVSNNSIENTKTDEIPLLDANEWNYDISADGSEIILTSYNGTSPNVTIPSKFKDDKDKIYTVSLVGGSSNSTFYNNFLIETITFQSIDNTKVKFSQDSSFLFRGCSKLTSINFNNAVDTSIVTDMNNMFEGCSSLLSIDISSFNTSSVTNMNKMFSSCTSITQINLTNIDTSNVTNMSEMFSYCSYIKEIDLSNLKTDNVINMNSMFRDCRSITTLQLNNFNTSKVTDMGHMFYRCLALTNIDVTRFNTSNVTNMTYMFSQCSKLPTLDLSSFTTEKVSNTSRMFDNCPLLKTYDLSKFNLANVTNKYRMFYTNTETELLIIAKDNTLKTYAYNGDNRIPFKIPFDANGGTFTINNITSETNTIPMPEIVEDTRESALTTLSNTIKGALIPNLEGKLFKYWYANGSINTPRVENSTSTRINITDNITLDNLVNEITTTNYARWNTVPVITANDITINKGDTSFTTTDSRLNISINDVEDGVISPTDKTKVTITSNVDVDTPGNYYIKYDVTDSLGDTATITITVTVNDPPVITAHGTTINVGQQIDLKTLIDSISDKEDGDAIKNSLEIIEDVDTTKPGKYEVTYKVTDSNKSSASTTVTVIVNGPPQITAHGTTINVGEQIDLKELIDSISDTEDGETIKDSLEIIGKVDTTKPGSYDITYKVTDSNGLPASTKVTVIVNGPPQITAEGITINVGNTIDLKDLIKDIYDKEDGNSIIDKDKVQITGEVHTNTPGKYDITYTVTDSNGLPASTTVTVIVNGPPIITAHGTTINVGQQIDLKELIDSIYDKEDGETINDKNKVQITGEVHTNTPGKYDITYTVTDSNGLSTSTTITVTVNDPPQITAQDTIINKGDSINLEDLIISATDLEDGNYTKDKVQISGEVDTNTPGDYEITYTVTDSNNATTTTTITVTVNDPPVITVGDKIEITTGDDFIITDHATADDKEDGTLTDKITIVDNGGLDTNKPGDYNVVIEVEDSNGAKDTQTVVVTVKPKPPAISADDVIINVGDNYDPSDNVIITDSNGNVIVITPDNIKDNNVNPNVPGKYEVTYTVTENGITVDKTITVTVLGKENKPPIIDGNDVVINVGDFYDPLGNVIATDANGNKIILNKDNIIYSDVNVNVPGVYTVKYLVTDENGLTAEKTLKVTVIDKQVSSAAIAQTNDVFNLNLMLLILFLSSSFAAILINIKRKKQ